MEVENILDGDWNGVGKGIFGVHLKALGGHLEHRPEKRTGSMSIPLAILSVDRPIVEKYLVQSGYIEKDDTTLLPLR